MSSKSSRMAWPYPDQGQAAWFDAFQAMVVAMDSSGYAAREDRHIIIMGGGTFLLSGSTLSWTENIELLAAITGFKWIIPGPGSITLDDGQMLYVTLSRAPAQNVTLTLKKGWQVPSTDNDLFFCIRSGSVAYFRNGRGILDGIPETIWKGATPAPGPGPSDITATTSVPLATGDALYLSGSGLVSLADATSPATVPTIGFSVTSVPVAPATCYIRRTGIIPVSIALVPGDTYWLNTVAGQITNNVAGFVPGNVIQELGVAFDPGNLLISLDADWSKL